MKERHRLYGVLFAGALLRCALLAVPAIGRTAETRLELASPVTSSKSLQEGLHLFRQGLDPYEGSIFRQAPLLLIIFHLIPSWSIPALYILSDLGTALAIASIAERKNAQGGEKPLQTWWIALLALFNPLGWMSSAARSSTTFSNLFISIALFDAVDGNVFLATYFFSVALHLSAPVILLPPLLCILAQSRKEPSRKILQKALPALAISQLTLLGAARVLTGSWTFLRAYSALFTVQDLTPNIGLYWYFFIEMFDHFRNFFILVFQAHLLCYSIPICLKLRFDPLLAFVILNGILATFKSYPTLGDTALYHSLLSLFPELIPHMRHPLATTMAHLYTLCLLPIFHHLWLYAGSGNSNFYYASTLVWALANGLGVIDTLGAGLKRQFLKEEKEAGHPALVEDWERPDEKAWSVVQQ